MTENHPITPPPKLFKQWEDDILNERENVDFVLDCAWKNGYRAGADAELEACCEWLGEAPVVYDDNADLHPGSCLRDARRPKPPTLAKQALLALYAISTGTDNTSEFYQDIETVQVALKRLQELENN